ncbi:MAG TPA: hypothetical protein VEO54_14325 [Thermoanaerobaculia bacterium]|nr:hypothetical protein [Thermoanaerobaculia bacterium]
MPSADGVTVVDFWVERSAPGEPFPIELDRPGVSAGSIHVNGRDPDTFALIAGLFAARGHLYYSASTETISTDPYFGDLAADDARVDREMEVIDVEVIWSLRTRNGRIILTLQNHQRVFLPMREASAALGWLLTIGRRRVTWDGENLISPRDEGTLPGA